MHGSITDEGVRRIECLRIDSSKHRCLSGRHKRIRFMYMYNVHQLVQHSHKSAIASYEFILKLYSDFHGVE